MSAKNHSWNSTTKKIAVLGILTALSLISFMLESLLPPLFLPGAKIGISNIFTLLTLFMFSSIDAFILIIVRTILGSLIVGNIFSLLYSLTAGLVSLLISSILVKFIFPKISLISISVVGAVIHNIVQNLVYCIVVQNINMLAYLPYLSIIGFLSGAVVGLMVYLVIHKIPLSFFERVIELKSNNIKESTC